MSDRLIYVLLVDDDTIYRLGLAQLLNGTEGWQVIGEKSNANVLDEPLGYAPDLIIFDPTQEDWQLCQSLKDTYPQSPILLLTNRILLDQDCLAAQKAGAKGYCPKRILVADLILILQRVANQESYWSGISTTLVSQVEPRQPHWLIQLGQSGINEIHNSLNQVQRQLNQSQVSALDWLYWRGRKRELMAASWLVRRLVPVDVPPGNNADVLEYTTAEIEYPILTAADELPTLTKSRSLGTSVILDRTLAKLQLPLINSTAIPLEIDVLKAPRKKELLYIVFAQVQTLLDELRFLEINYSELLARKNQIAQDIWRKSSQKFLGVFYTEQTTKTQDEIDKIILEESRNINQDILKKIPFLLELFAYLLYEKKLIIDNIDYPTESPESLDRAGIILENLIIQVANAVVAMVLNNYSDTEAIKALLYDKTFISSREIAKFRNDLSWKYRSEKYWEEPQLIFESRHRLFAINNSKVELAFVYAPRQNELQRLGGWRWFVTIALETRDAISPQLQAVFGWLGAGVVYVLTQVIGRGIGLIGRGIIQGVGSTWQDVRYGKKK